MTPATATGSPWNLSDVSICLAEVIKNSSKKKTAKQIKFGCRKNGNELKWAKNEQKNSPKKDSKTPPFEPDFSHPHGRLFLQQGHLQLHPKGQQPDTGDFGDFCWSCMIDIW